MKLIAITSREINGPRNDEKMDALDTRLIFFIKNINMMPVILPNEPALCNALLDRISPDGFILSGGGDISACTGTRTRRDQMEEGILLWASQHHRPVLGVCRGFQVMLAAAGLDLHRVTGHVGAGHSIEGTITGHVNSYHDYACVAENAHVSVLARAPDGIIEAATFRGQKRMGIMWHPEREPEFKERDVQIIRDFFSGEL
ncbi:gamma-glutamyl-gamma-aminobutyrate hydrolase family protein [Serratia plymuthica]|uniref:Gamma-glutamyl-gamma-aminobutyrate hydrolase family protein n=1 Tax=Serratia plymuthica TaxID=82996 RepID=A0A2X4U400_SERPL|nr:gamma-glutamyl-gamma-aminobutyrate hydrolase family protein [Serratia plymuthica]QPS22001.1 gamma-glutamyl-gamma-aminobutyrate hydrolase family protein [Serratia plymuthica]QPS63612.1 gamma-glutamyl-gamma-aminobutyrate hydrolase family protein [Serratia plymuthica]RKS64019.1 putative glutamine amidotransferase [Serratia plymuthica]CAI2488631.1 Putative glutamine amidotransferase Rv2859c [Serratia plymuthica]SQI33771.1 Putative glutamine amidotransferase Rv2859c [Serratia plymuthica]